MFFSHPGSETQIVCGSETQIVSQRFSFSGLISGRSYIEPREYHSKKFNTTLAYFFSTRYGTRTHFPISDLLRLTTRDADPNLVGAGSFLPDPTLNM